MNTQTKHTFLWLMLLIFILTACSRGPEISAPEIDPPPDLIPSYVPENFKLESGFMIDTADITARIIYDEGELRVPWNANMLFTPYRSIISPAGNETLGVYYISKDQVILITKSYFPGGTLEQWREHYEKSDGKDCVREDCECNCCCPHIELSIGITVPPRFAEIQEERTINGTPVAILKGHGGWISVFVRDDYLVSVESGISLEENLKIVNSLLE